MKEFKDKYKGEECFIFAPGPTLNTFDLSMLRNDIYKVGVNGTIIHDEIRDILDIYVWAGDVDTIEHPQPNAPIIYEKCKMLRTEVVKFVCCYTNKGFYYPNFRIPTQIHPDMIRQFGFNIFNQTAPSNLNPDLEKYGLDCNSVAFQTMQIVLYMGFSSITLVGFDCGGDHSYKDIVSNDVCDWGKNSLVSLWIDFKNSYIDRYYPSVDIKVWNPVGLSEIFKQFHDI